MDKRSFVLILLALHLRRYEKCFAADTKIGTSCESPQYLSLGKPGTVNCVFGNTFFGVYWYNSTEYQTTQPFLYYTNNKKSGTGYSSKEFDIYPNGSLKINNVSFQHNHNFTVVMFRTSAEETIPNYIRVVVTVKPSFQDYPIIEACNGERFCSRHVNELTTLRCYINKSSPTLDLDFFIQTKDTDVPLLTTKYSDDNHQIHRNTVILRLPISTHNIINVVACKAAEPPKLLLYHESLILLESEMGPSIQIKPSKDFIEVNSKLELFCTNETITYIVWKKRVQNGTFISLVELMISLETEYVFTSAEKYKLNGDRTWLTIQHTLVSDEGLYTCIWGDGITEGVYIFNISVYVPPDPPYLIVEGCNNHEHCTLTVEETGQITCILKGIRPQVLLEWEYVDPKASTITHAFRSDQLVSKWNGETYDISITITYDVSNIPQDRVTLVCNAKSIDEGFQLQLSTKLSLLILKETNEVQNGGKKRNQLAIILSVVVATILVIVCTLAIGFACLKHQRGQNIKNEYEMCSEKRTVPTNLESQRAVFKQLLTNVYKERCEVVRLLPIDSRTKLRVDDIFVEGEIELLGLNSRGQETWQKLSSHNDIFRRTTETDTRIILEGGAGFGKTVLCLQMAHDWYSRNELSTLKTVDFFIYIHMRYIDRNITLCQAIKQYILPSDCEISVETIKNILSSASSVVIALDSYNRYPLKNEYETTFIKKLMMKQTFARVQVILTSRPTCLPPSFANLTKIMRLVGFDENAQNEYIRKVVVRDEEKVKRIKDLFQQIPGVYAFCQVPLFFTLLVNLMNAEKISYNDVSADTVTEFFKCILKALQQNTSSQVDEAIPHEKDKLISEDYNHRLYRVSFEGLGQIWEKRRIEKALGKELYNMQRRLGILIEEEVYENINKSGATNYDNMDYRKKVKFYHNVFCQWYAAHHLARLAKKSNHRDLAKILKNINLMEHQYVYRFACGLDDKAAKNIIKYVENIKDGENFAKLCIFEQNGRGIQAISDVVVKLCSSPVHISKDDGMLLQRSITQLLKLASDNEIPIEIVWIAELNIYFNHANESLKFSSGIKLPKLETLIQLSINESKKEFSDEEFIGILRYANLCTKLVGLRFLRCILPLHVDVGHTIPKELRERQVSVDWVLPISGKPCYRLNLKLGQWEVDGDQMTTDLQEKLRNTIIPLPNKIEPDLVKFAR